MAYAHPKLADAQVRDDADGTGTPLSAEQQHILHDGTEHRREALLVFFTADENKAIMRQVDMRFLWLIGISYLTKSTARG